MLRPFGVSALALSFIIVSILIIVGSNLYWVGEPADSPWHPVQMVVEHGLGIIAGAIGIGLFLHKNMARRLAFISLILVAALGIGALGWDVLSQRTVWLVLDIVLIVLLAIPAGYLMFPSVRDAFHARRT